MTELDDQLREALGGRPEEDLAKLIATRSPQLICIDDAHRIIRPRIGGLHDFDALTSLARSAGDKTAWVFSIATPAWQYLSRARSERAIFEEVIELGPWSEESIGTLLEARTAALGMEPSFESVVVPRQIDIDEEDDETTRTESDFYRLIWNTAKGNPAVALHLWRESLCRDLNDGVRVRLFKAAEAGALSDLPASLYFVLRTITQLELAHERDLADCTGLQSADIAEALHFAWGRGFLQRIGERYCIALPWYRAVTDQLRRQHLLMT